MVQKQSRRLRTHIMALVLLVAMLFVITGCDELKEFTGRSSSKEPETVEIEDGALAVHFLDVGQGNSVLLENNDEYMLIDGGDSDYSSFVVSYLKKQGVEKLEYIISSHYDADHINGLVGALNAFDVSNVLDADYEADSRVYNSFVKAVKAENCEETHPEVGDTFSFGDAQITVVCPSDYNNADANDNSIGVRIVYGSTSFLICGDASTEIEKEMLASKETLESTVYMCSHHGSKTASSEAFLDAVNPEYAVVSAGLENSYNHPNKEVMERLEDRNIEVFRTDLQGTIVVQSDGKALTWNVESSGDYRSGDELAEDSDSNKASLNKVTTTKDTASEDEQEKTASTEEEQTFILNTSTKKFHLPDCSSVDDMLDKNKKEVTSTKEELEREGYSPCKNCIGE